MPSAWKRSNVTPVHKGGDTDDPGNYRPISVVPIIAKVLEKIIATQLSSYMEHHHLLHDLQGAYCHGRSADQILLYATDIIVQAIDAGKHVCATFLDLRKAFDSLDYHVLLKRLFELGVGGIELQWFSDYLTDRKQKVKCGNQYSDWDSALGGIPQGSALGPLLFLIYVNQMPFQVSSADDTCLICSAESSTAVAAMLQDDLNALSQWIVMSKMRLNLKKSSVMWLSIKQSAAAVPQVMIGDTALSVVCKQKYLGVMFDSQLN